MQCRLLGRSKAFHYKPFQADRERDSPRTAVLWLSLKAKDAPLGITPQSDAQGCCCSRQNVPLYLDFMVWGSGVGKRQGDLHLSDAPMVIQLGQLPSEELPHLV